MIEPPAQTEGTEIRGNDGKALVLYHGTIRHFQQFDREHLVSVGFHFGCLEQANYFTRNHPDGRIFPAYLKSEHLIDLGNSDLGWEGPCMTAMLLRMSLMTVGININFPDVFFCQDLVTAQDRDRELKDAEKREFNLQIVDTLIEHGYDAIKYTNKQEPPDGQGRAAYLVLKAEQIYSALTGECLGQISY